MADILFSPLLGFAAIGVGLLWIWNAYREIKKKPDEAEVARQNAVKVDNEFAPQNTNIFRPQNTNTVVLQTFPPPPPPPAYAKFTFEKTQLWIPTLPLDFRTQMITSEEKVPDSLNEYERNVKVPSVRYEYQTELGLVRSVEVKAQIMIFNEQELLVPKYDAVWHKSFLKSLRFKSGDWGDLVLGVFTTEGISAYQYRMTTRTKGLREKYLNPILVPLAGEEFYLYVHLIGMAGEEKVVDLPEIFRLRPNDHPLPVFEVLSEPPPHLMI